MPCLMPTTSFNEYIQFKKEKGNKEKKENENSNQLNSNPSKKLT